MTKPQALYDINKNFLENWQTGPIFSEPPPQRHSPKAQYSWLGFKLASRIGVAACPIMTGKGIPLLAQQGFAVLTYKSIRSRAHPGNPMPNILYVNCPKPLSKADLSQPLLQAQSEPDGAELMTITNSFGNGSLAPEEVGADIALAKSSLSPGQVLIVSVYGEAGEQRTQVEDFVYVASLAVAAGADIIELNLSCPNIHAGRGLIYDDPEYVYAIAHAVVKAHAATPVIIKLGWLADSAQLTAILQAAARAGVAGVSGINSLSMRVLNEQQQPAFGAERPVSGVSGYPIHQLALEFTKTACQINSSQGLGLSTIGMGGITQPEHFNHFHQAGVDIALCATGVMWNPYLGIAYQRGHNE